MDSSLDKKLTGFRQISQEKLQNIFLSIPGSQKDIIIEPSLIKPLEFVCGASWLKNKGIDKIYKFDSVNPPPRRHQFIYLITADLIVFKYVLDQISGYESREPSEKSETGLKLYHLIVFPTILNCFEELLESEGLYGLVELYRFSWDFISLDSGVLSLEYGPRLFRDVYIRGDTSLLGPIAHTFRLYNMVLKRPHMILTYGEQSEAILNMVSRIENARNAPYRDESKDNPDFTTMILLDRDKDYASALLTSVVYSSLLLELFQYKSGYVTIDVENNRIVRDKLKFLQIQKPPASSSKKDVATLRMHTGDKIFNENRYRHFADVISLLSSQAKNLGVESKTYKEMKITEMKEFVANKLPQVAAQKKELFKHLIACEAIVQELGATFERHQSIEENMLLNENRKQVMAYIEEQISTDAHKFNTIRLMCLLHITCGVTPDEATKFITNYCNAFGHQYLTIFTKLSHAKLFPELGTSNKSNILSNISIPLKQTPFQIDANKLKLFPVAPKESPVSQSPTKSPGIPLKKDSTCSSYVFNGNYIPLVAQLAQTILKANTFEEVSNKLTHLDTQIKVSGKAFGDSIKNLRDAGSSIKRGEINGPNFPLRPRTVFIYIVGGVTYAEIAACNLVERFTGSKIVLASDSIISGNDLIETAFN